MSEAQVGALPIVVILLPIKPLRVDAVKRARGAQPQQ
jgi:hypothetical protein